MTEGTDPAAGDPVAAWAASGAMALTGHADGPPLSPAAAVVPALAALADAFTRLAVQTAAPPAVVRPPASLGQPSTIASASGSAASDERRTTSLAGSPAPSASAESTGPGSGGDPVVDVGQLLSGRAGLLGLSRRGQVSANGSSRLLPAADGWVAVNLARPSDLEAVGALVERVVDDDPWTVLARSVERLPGADLVERAVLLGIPAAAVPAPAEVSDVGLVPVSVGVRPTPSDPGGGRAAHGTPPPAAEAGSGRAAGRATHAAPPFVLRRLGAAREDGPAPAGLVVDLSAMWAGPLCARLLGLAGLRVVKVESTQRPDGARAGDARFFDWLHGGHESVALDLTTAGGRAALGQLIAAADVVIESSRPRALTQLGIDAEDVVGARPGVTWVSITGHGRDGDAGQRVAFGDDAAVAAGLVAYDDEGRPVFCGDAIADPITGLSAAVGALTSIAAGGGHLVDVPMVDAVAATLTVPVAAAPARQSTEGIWQVATATGVHPVAGPQALPPAPVPAAAFGADTAAVLRALGVAPC